MQKLVLLFTDLLTRLTTVKGESVSKSNGTIDRSIDLDFTSRYRYT